MPTCIDRSNRNLKIGGYGARLPCRIVEYEHATLRVVHILADRELAVLGKVARKEVVDYLLSRRKDPEACLGINRARCVYL